MAQPGCGLYSLRSFFSFVEISMLTHVYLMCLSSGTTLAVNTHLLSRPRL